MSVCLSARNSWKINEWKLRITGFLDFVHNVSETGSVSVLRCGGENTLLGPLGSQGPNRVGIFPPSPEDGNRSSFRNVVFSSF
jgi:hypothetical protein